MNENLQEALEALVDGADRLQPFSTTWQLYQRTKGAGHTLLMLEGVRNYRAESSFVEPIIVCASQAQTAFFAEYKATPVPIDNLPKLLYETPRPIAWDNYAIINFIGRMFRVQQDIERIRPFLESSE